LTLNNIVTWRYRLEVSQNH